MYCRNCGKEVAEQATTCDGCGASLAAPGPAATAAALAADRVKAASKDALSAFKTFVFDPVGGLSEACASLGPSRALGVGIVFGVVAALCVVLGFYRLMAGFARPSGLGGFIKILVAALVPFASLFGATLAARKVFRGEGGVGQDSFIAGASLLPFGVAVFLSGILRPGNIEVITVLTVFAICLTILMLFAGLTRICRISERSATLAVPLTLVASAWFSKIIYTALFS